MKPTICDQRCTSTRTLTTMRMCHNRDTCCSEAKKFCLRITQTWSALGFFTVYAVLRAIMESWEACRYWKQTRTSHSTFRWATWKPWLIHDLAGDHMLQITICRRVFLLINEAESLLQNENGVLVLWRQAKLHSSTWDHW